LPPELQGRIGDFLESTDRSSMRETSKANLVVYSTTPRHEFLIRQRLTMLHRKSGTKLSSLSRQEHRLKVNQYSSEIGTYKQRKEILDDTFNIFSEEISNFKYNVLNFLTDHDPPPPLPPGYHLEDWLAIRGNFGSIMFERALSLRPPLYWDVSLFSPSELQDLIRERISRDYPFPVTFVKIKEIDLLAAGVETIDELVDFIDDTVLFNYGVEFWNWVKSLFTRFLHGDGSTSIDPLREFLTYQYTHEIRVDLHRLEQVPYPFEASPAEGSSAGASSGASEGGAGSGGGKRRRE